MTEEMPKDADSLELLKENKWLQVIDIKVIVNTTLFLVT
jgi:hypothetical protein